MIQIKKLQSSKLGFSKVSLSLRGGLVFMLGFGLFGLGLGPWFELHNLATGHPELGCVHFLPMSNNKRSEFGLQSFKTVRTRESSVRI